MKAVFGFLSGNKAADTEKEMKKWIREVSRTERNFDRELNNLKRMEIEQKQACSRYIKTNNRDAAKNIAKGIANIRKTKLRFEGYKLHLESARGTLNVALMDLKHTQVVKHSADMMTTMRKLTNIPAVRKDMLGMAREMQRAGFMAETKDDIFALLDDDEVVEFDEDIASIMTEISAGKEGSKDKGSNVHIKEQPADPVAPISLPSVPTTIMTGPSEEEEADDLEERYKKLVGM